MIDAIENAALNMTPARTFERTNSSVIADLGMERFNLDGRIQKLKKAIEADPANVSASQKKLWGSQLDAMQRYKEALSARIVDLIDSDK